MMSKYVPAPDDPLAALPGQQRDAKSDEPERSLWSGCYSARAMVGVWTLLAALTLLSPLAMLVIPPAGLALAWMVTGGVLAFGWVLAIGAALYRSLVDHYELTSQRLKHRRGILFRRNDRMELIDIDDVIYRQGPLQAVLGVGTIEIRSTDTSHPVFLMPGIAGVREVADLIDDARRTERRQRGLHIESI